MKLRQIGAALIFLAVFLGVLGSAHYYLVSRIALQPQWPEGVANGVVATLILGFGVLVVQGLLRRRLGVVSKLLSWVAYIWLGFLFYVFILTAFSELAKVALQLVPDAIDPVSFARGRALGIVGLSLAITAIAVRRGLAPPTHKRIEVSIDGLPPEFDGFSIVQISDIHIGPLLDRRFAQHLTDRVNALKPDLVAVTGDLVDGRVEQLRSEVEPFRDVSAQHGVFFVTGNHDFYSGADDWVECVTGFGWQVLRNRSVTITSGTGASFDLVGVDDPHGAMLDGVGSEDLESALQNTSDNNVLILLAHDPATFRRTRKTRVALQLSGHTHGGQIWPFGWAVRASVPWVAGLYRDGTNQIYVSCGTGFWGPPMRFGTEAEITELILKVGGEDGAAAS
ncbi:MAG: putative MPP superfamily phosphohydrolase [Myxococcota bacterium]